MRFPRSVVVLASVALLVSATARTAAARVGDDPGSSVVLADPGGHADTELLNALRSVELLDEWFDRAGGAMSVAGLRVIAGVGYEAARSEALTLVAAMKSDLIMGADRSHDFDRLEQQIDEVDRITTEIRRRILNQRGETTDLLALDPRSGDRRPSKNKVEPISARRGTHPVDAVENRLSTIKAELALELSKTTQSIARGLKSMDAVTSGLSQVRQDLTQLRLFAVDARAASAEAQARVEWHRAGLITLFDRMHALRQLARTSISGLPLVTLEAYVNGAAMSADRCAIDWTVLAGIARIESRHGTLDGSSVLRDGELSLDIYGPLLDGGATARAARDAALAAAEPVETELLEPVDPGEPVFDPALWNQPPDGAPIGSEPDSAAAGSLSGEERSDGFDVRLWGPPLSDDPSDHGPEPSDESPDSENEDGDDDADTDESRPTGNGFAVIVDTDRGVLDGNARWDRAVGPMQFIPETWERWKIDGNHDGVIDPQNLFDAAATAGRFLCSLQRRFGSSPRDYLLGYNPSTRYASDVIASANHLAAYQLPEVSLSTD